MFFIDCIVEISEQQNSKPTLSLLPDTFDDRSFALWLKNFESLLSKDSKSGINQNVVFAIQVSRCRFLNPVKNELHILNAYLMHAEVLKRENSFSK